MNSDELDEIRLRIAKACRWHAEEKEGLHYILHPDTNITVTPGYPTEMAAWYDAFSRNLPNWPQDMAAAYRLEDSIPPDLRKSYATQVMIILYQDLEEKRSNSMWDYIHATPDQRCRAWLQVMEAKP